MTNSLRDCEGQLHVRPCVWTQRNSGTVACLLRRLTVPEVPGLTRFLRFFYVKLEVGEVLLWEAGFATRSR